MMKNSFICLICFVFCILFVNSIHMEESEIAETVNEKVITCGSSLRIQNEITKYYLSSYGMNWSTGSHLQIVTGIKEDNDYNSLFIIKEGHGETPCENGTPIKCNDIIRLEHVTTGKNIHSHPHRSFITNSQEACAFGENGEGDVNDNFKIICYKWKEELVKGKTNFFLQHVPSGQYLYINYKTSLFKESNCRGCSINGQREVSLTETKDKQCLWHVAGGIIFSLPQDEETN